MIYFDFFGVLSTPVYWSVIQAFLPQSQHDAWYKKLDALDTGAISEEDFVEEIAKQANVASSEIWQAVENAPTLNFELLAYISDQLAARHTVGLLTNIPRSLFERLLTKEQQDIFQVKLLSSDLGFIKPNPQIFQIAIEQAGCAAHDILFIDDSEKNVVEARRQGIESVLYSGNELLFSYLQNWNN